MKKEKRQIYLILASEVNSGLAPFCKYAVHQGYSSFCEEADDGYYECHHSLYRVQEQMEDSDCGFCMEPDVDCWGFSPEYSIQDIADIVGIILQNGWTRWGWILPKANDGKIEVYGRK